MKNQDGIDFGVVDTSEMKPNSSYVESLLFSIHQISVLCTADERMCDVLSQLLG
jgi:hypothetical protein